jgi:hypothetical protein
VVRFSQLKALRKSEIVRQDLAKPAVVGTWLCLFHHGRLTCVSATDTSLIGGNRSEDRRYGRFGTHSAPDGNASSASEPACPHVTRQSLLRALLGGGGAQRRRLDLIWLNSAVSTIAATVGNQYLVGGS